MEHYSHKIHLDTVTRSCELLDGQSGVQYINCSPQCFYPNFGAAHIIMTPVVLCFLLRSDCPLLQKFSRFHCVGAPLLLHTFSFGVVLTIYHTQFRRVSVVTHMSVHFDL